VDTQLNLEGATVELRELGWRALTDKSGRYEFTAVPAGNYTLVGSYTGVEMRAQPAQVSAGGTTEVNFELRSNIYQMEGLVVTGEREGNAASITRQRNSANVRTVLSLDAFGSLPSENMGELLIRMPGVAGGLNEEGVIATVGVRGTPPALNTLTIDGDTQPGSSTLTRTGSTSRTNRRARFKAIWRMFIRSRNSSAEP